LNWIAAGGTLLIAGLITTPVLSISLARAARAYVTTLKPRCAILTVVTLLALGCVMKQSGQTITLGRWVAGAGGILAFIGPMISWLGVGVTGSDRSSNSLFGALQVTAAKQSGLSPILMAAANRSGGVLGKDDLAPEPGERRRGVGRAGQEGEISRPRRLEPRPCARHVRDRVPAVD
jgi:lactate permease